MAFKLKQSLPLKGVEDKRPVSGTEAKKKTSGTDIGDYALNTPERRQRYKELNWKQDETTTLPVTQNAKSFDWKETGKDLLKSFFIPGYQVAKTASNLYHKYSDKGDPNTSSKPSPEKNLEYATPNASPNKFWPMLIAAAGQKMSDNKEKEGQWRK